MIRKTFLQEKKIMSFIFTKAFPLSNEWVCVRVKRLTLKTELKTPKCCYTTPKSLFYSSDAY